MRDSTMPSFARLSSCLGPTPPDSRSSCRSRRCTLQGHPQMTRHLPHSIQSLCGTTGCIHSAEAGLGFASMHDTTIHIELQCTGCEHVANLKYSEVCKCTLL